ncbi:hypothetical protein [Mycobacterium sp.]|uniref:PPW family C-terminal domain-containing PPE protein n=1 Tax=Mycobacterium sp. TaxID=1785 RepID=UPI003F9D979D
MARSRSHSSSCSHAGSSRNCCAGPQGFAGTATKTGAGRAAGLTTLADDAFGASPRMPMIPGTWGADSPAAPESDAGR